MDTLPITVTFDGTSHRIGLGGDKNDVRALINHLFAAPARKVPILTIEDDDGCIYIPIASSLLVPGQTYSLIWVNSSEGRTSGEGPSLAPKEDSGVVVRRAPKRERASKQKSRESREKLPDSTPNWMTSSNAPSLPPLPSTLSVNTANPAPIEAVNTIESTEAKQYRCSHRWRAKATNELDILVGDLVEMLEDVGNGWLWGRKVDTGAYGLFPASYVIDASLVEIDDDPYQDEEYFGQYSAAKIHREMLDDTARTEAYQESISDMKGKVVMDVGCGSGILSLFCATAGASKVYAVEASDMADVATRVVEDNGVNHIVRVIKGKVETIDLDEKVDIIVSEWMGTLLVFESMLESVLVARDRFLVDGGTLYPHRAKLFIAACSVNDLWQNEVEWWDKQYGYDMKGVRSIAAVQSTQRPRFDTILKKEDVMSSAACIWDLDLKTVEIDDLESVERSIDLDVSKNGIMHGFAAWFEVDFPTTILSTSPSHPPTHWKQDLFLFQDPLSVSAGDVISLKIAIVRNAEWRRHVKIDLSCEIDEERKREKVFNIWR